MVGDMFFFLRKVTNVFKKLIYNIPINPSQPGVA